MPESPNALVSYLSVLVVLLGIEYTRLKQRLLGRKGRKAMGLHIDKCQQTLIFD
jgi:hypothetical protein